MKESEIRPHDIFEEYLRLSALDGQKLDQKKFVSTGCGACNSSESRVHFQKNGYIYRLCQTCGTLFCSPRPRQAQLASLYFDSPSSTYWSNTFFPGVAEARREKIFKPKAQKVVNLLSELGGEFKELCDVGAGHGIFLEEMGALLGDIKLCAVEPDATSASVLRSKNIEVLRETSDTSQEWHGRFDFVLSSEVIEHVFNPIDFAKSLCELVKPGGYCLITGLGYEGFDILTLQENSKAVSPPHHLNFLSVDGFEKMMKLAGFSSVKIWTPGLLDVDIVMNSEVNNEFLRVLRKRGSRVMDKFQKFLSENQLSSHIWILGQK